MTYISNALLCSCIIFSRAFSQVKTIYKFLPLCIYDWLLCLLKHDCEWHNLSKSEQNTFSAVSFFFYIWHMDSHIWSLILLNSFSYIVQYSSDAKKILSNFFIASECPSDNYKFILEYLFLLLKKKKKCKKFF